MTSHRNRAAAAALAALGGVAVIAATLPVGDAAAPARAAQVRLIDTAGSLGPFDTWDPAVGQLEPGLLAALQNAANAASADGVSFTVTSGWRSTWFQQSLLDDAIRTYGSYQAARQWVQTPEHSHHVTGAAVDIGGTAAQQWLQNNGGQFGLCRIYANEPWHFELAADGYGNCPTLLPNAAG